MARDIVLPPPQVSGSVSSGAPTPVITSGGNLEPPIQRAIGILGTASKVGPTVFPTIPSSFNSNAHFYPGLSYSYRGAAMVETPSHGQIRYATYDIQNIQLTMRGGISTDILAAWQLALTSPASIIPGY